MRWRWGVQADRQKHGKPCNSIDVGVVRKDFHALVPIATEGWCHPLAPPTYPSALLPLLHSVYCPPAPSTSTTSSNLPPRLALPQQSTRCSFHCSCSQEFARTTLVRRCVRYGPVNVGRRYHITWSEYFVTKLGCTTDAIFWQLTGACTDVIEWFICLPNVSGHWITICVL